MTELTDEQTAAADKARELKRLSSDEGQAAEFRDALMQAMTAMNLELGALGVKPNIVAVIRALTMLQAEFVAMDPSRNGRRMRMVEIEHNLSKLVAMRLTLGSKFATETPPAGEVN